MPNVQRLLDYGSTLDAVGKVASAQAQNCSNEQGARCLDL